MKYYISIQIYKKRALKKTASTFKTKKKTLFVSNTAKNKIIFPSGTASMICY